MKNELSVLLNINNDGNTTQRDIAKSTGMSLGNVNILIKRLVSKGLLKIEKLNPRTIRYILTPKGLKEKTEATYRYVVDSYRMITDVDHKIGQFLDDHKYNDETEFILFGQRDELFQLISNKIEERNITYTVIEEPYDLHSKITGRENFFVMVWNPRCIEVLEATGIGYMNLLGRV